MVHNMHSTYPQARFVVYDLGLTEEQGADARRWCNARYVSFDFGRYPEHEQLNELGTFFWLDASPRLTCPDLSIFPRAVLNGSVEPFVTFGHSEHSIFAATHPGMLEYFPVDDVELLKVTEVKYATAMFVSDSAYTRMVLKWVVLCALTNDCIAPDGHYLYCKFKHRYRDYGNCHRYDQSAFALARLHLLYLRGHYKLLARADHSTLVEMSTIVLLPFVLVVAIAALPCFATGTGGAVGAAGCVDNVSGGGMDCANSVRYCTVALYAQLMRTECPLTCGFCTASGVQGAVPPQAAPVVAPGSATCVDKNAVGRGSDCPRIA
ncbi:Protein F28G4.3, partial [Aphelenchoides avenae]